MSLRSFGSPHARARLAWRPRPAQGRRFARFGQHGFTLMEFLVVTGLAMLILAALGGFQRAQMFAMREQEARVEAQSATRATLDVMLREIRMAGYSGPCPNDIAPIIEALNDRVRIQIDWDEDGAIGAGEDITYAYDGASQEIQRTVIGEAGDLAIPIMANVSSSDIFRYLDANGAETGTLADIRSVAVDVRVAQANPRPDVESDIVSGLEAEAVVRNSGFECEEEDDDSGSSGGSGSSSGKSGSSSGKSGSSSGSSGSSSSGSSSGKSGSSSGSSGSSSGKSGSSSGSSGSSSGKSGSSSGSGSS